MKPSRLTEEQIIGILREQEAGAKAADVCRKHGISSATFYPCAMPATMLPRYPRLTRAKLTGKPPRMN